MTIIWRPDACGCKCFSFLPSGAVDQGTCNGAARTPGLAPDPVPKPLPPARKGLVVQGLTAAGGLFDRPVAAPVIEPPLRAETGVSGQTAHPSVTRCTGGKPTWSSVFFDMDCQAPLKVRAAPPLRPHAIGRVASGLPSASEIALKRLDGALGLPEVPALVSWLSDRMPTENIDLDLTGLTAIDVAGVQVLLAARAEAEVLGRAFDVRLPQDGPVPAMLARLGIEDALDPSARTQDPEQETTP